MSTKKILILTLVALAALLVVGCRPGLFPNFTYQGRLTDQNGKPITGNVSIRYNLYKESSGGTAFHTQTETVAVKDGLFTSVVGPSALGADPKYLTGPIYMGVKVGTDAEMTPRQRLYGAPYAFTLMPGAIISETFDTTTFGGANLIQGITTIVNNYDGDAITTVGGNPALPALKIIGEQGLVLRGIGTGDDGTIFSDWTDTDSDLIFYTEDEYYIFLDTKNDTAGNNFYVWGNPTTNYCRITEVGNLTCTGTISPLANTPGGEREVYSVSSPEVWIEDFGSGQLNGGASLVTIGGDYTEVVNLTAGDYHVFLTPLGDCNGLYVSKKTATGFEVSELGGGKASVAFDYRIVAKRSGYETQRMEPVQVELDD